MNKLLVLLAAIVAAQVAAAAPGAVPGPTARTYSYWLHPKLGMVKVDRATNAIVVARREHRDAARAPAR